jgi:ABC-type dipeptide/oligopeptide/nickel transport system permease subunit
MTALLGRVAVVVIADKRILIGGAMMVLMALVTALAPFISPYDPSIVFSGLRNAPPGTAGHILGTDQGGRDILSRLIWGGRLTLLMGTLPVAAAMLVGTVLGLLAAYFNGAVEWVVLRVMEVLFAFPLILLAILAAQILGKGMLNAMAAMTITVVPYVIRASHAAAKGTMGLTYVEAARIRGAGPAQIMFREILPAILPSLIAFAVSMMPIFVIFSAGLSYLGLAIEPPTPEWGMMIAEGQRTIQVAPHVSTIPGILLLITSLALNLMGDGIQDALDPRVGQGRHARSARTGV